MLQILRAPTRRSGSPPILFQEELASPYYAWRLKGVHVDVASVKGGEVLFDPASKEGDFLTSAASRFLEDSEIPQRPASRPARRPDSRLARSRSGACIC